MDIDYFEPGARLIPALRDTPCAPTAGTGHGALRAEAIRQVRSQLREWQRVPTMHTTGSPCLVVASERAKLHDSLDLLQRAGEDVPPWLYRQGALVWSMNAASGITAGVSLVNLLADITRVLAWFDAAPSPLGADADVVGDDGSARERP